MKTYTQREVIAEMVLNPGKVFESNDSMDYFYRYTEGNRFEYNIGDPKDELQWCNQYRTLRLFERANVIYREWPQEEPNITITLKQSDWDKVKDIVNGAEVVK